MTLYADSSAVLAWLLGEPSGRAVGDCLTLAEVVAASDLTLVECERAIVRSVAIGGMPDATGAVLRSRLRATSEDWMLLGLGEEVLDRARRPFPEEPVRTLDALHLGSALLAKSALPDLAVLSLDSRLRANARALGFEIQPQ